MLESSKNLSPLEPISQLAEREMLAFFSPFTDYDYMKAVCFDAENSKERFINNTSFEHAAIVIFNLVRTANKKILIVSQSLNDVVYGNRFIIDYAKKFVDRGGSFEVKPAIYADAFASRFHSELNSHKSGCIKIHPQLKVSANVGHDFLVTDTGGYRFEQEPTLKGSEFSSSVQFLNKDLAEKLIQLFRILK